MDEISTFFLDGVWNNNVWITHPIHVDHNTRHVDITWLRIMSHDLYTSCECHMTYCIHHVTWLNYTLLMSHDLPCRSCALFGASPLHCHTALWVDTWSSSSSLLQTDHTPASEGNHYSEPKETCNDYMSVSVSMCTAWYWELLVSWVCWLAPCGSPTYWGRLVCTYQPTNSS